MRANVAVETFSVVNGPGTTKLFDALLELNSKGMSGQNDGKGVKTTFTVTTAASLDPIKVTVAICHLSRQPGDRPTQVYFSGICQNTPVDGVYDFQVHQGFFTAR